MKKKALYLEHLAEGQRSAPIRLLLTEPEEGANVRIHKMKGAGDGWLKSTVEIAGAGRLFSYRSYNVDTTTVFTSTVSESVLALRIQVINESYSGFRGKGTGTALWPEDTCCLFWMGDRTIESRLLPGEHVHCDLFFRLDSLGALTENERIKDLVERAQLLDSGAEMPAIVNVGWELEDFFMNTMLPEMLGKSMTLARFHYLCDCIVLLCFGEHVDVQQVAISTPDDSMEDAVDAQVQLFVEEEELLFARLKDLSRRQLVRKFGYLRKRVHQLRDRWGEARETEDMLNRFFIEERNAQSDLLADALLGNARFFADIHDRDGLTDEEKSVIREAIVLCANRAFNFRLPGAEEAAFYTEWSGQPYVSPPLLRKDFLGMLSELMPEVGLDTLGLEGSGQDYRLIQERIRDIFGFKPMSYFMGEKEKPKEITVVYQRLMEYLSDTLQLQEGEGVERSDVVRIVDNAYECDDYTMLLQLEVLYLGGSKGYVFSQDDTRLCHLIVAMEMEKKELNSLLRNIERNSYPYVLYRSMGGDIVKVKERIISDMDDTREWADELLSSLRRLSKDADSKDIITIVRVIAAVVDMDF